MARLGFEYKVDIEGTDVSGDFSLMPDMIAALEATAIDLLPHKDASRHSVDNGDPDCVQANITFEILEPEEFKGRRIWTYWTIRHTDSENGAYKFGKRMFDKFCRAVHVEYPEDTDDLRLKAFPAKIGRSKGGPKPGGGNYDDKNEIKDFFFTDDRATKPVPEIGVLAGQPVVAKPANDNKPATRPAAAAAAAAAAPAAGARRPWGTK
ncbi:MAG: hypothetical protein H5U22_06625 [Rhizobium sp.]|nr:hypothetical protein [Rhizobium sp.]